MPTPIFNQLVTVGQTPVQLPDFGAIQTLIAKALAGNTDQIIIGDNTVTSGYGGNVFVELDSGQGVSLAVQSAQTFWAVAPSGTQSLTVGAITT